MFRNVLGDESSKVENSKDHLEYHKEAILPFYSSSWNDSMPS